MLLQYRTGQDRAIGFGILSVLGRPASTCDPGYMAAWCLSALKDLRMNLDSCLLFHYQPLLLFPAASVLLPGATCGHFYMYAFLFPYLCMKKKHSIHSFIPQIRCGVQASLFLLHFRHLSECRKSSWRAGALYYLGFVEEVSLIVAFVKPISLETHWHINRHPEGFWDVLHSTGSSEALVVKCASLWEILVFPFPLLISVCPRF